MIANISDFNLIYYYYFQSIWLDVPKSRRKGMFTKSDLESLTSNFQIFRILESFESCINFAEKFSLHSLTFFFLNLNVGKLENEIAKSFQN